MLSRTTRSLASLWLVALVVLVLASLAQPASAEDASFGYWKSVDEDTGKTDGLFRLWEDKGKLVGKILRPYPYKGKPAVTICTECSGAQKDKPVTGMIFMWGFTRDPATPGKWVDGKILNPQDGKTYHCELELSPDGKTLKVYGYIRLVVKIGGTRYWQRPTPEELAPQ